MPAQHLVYLRNTGVHGVTSAHDLTVCPFVVGPKITDLHLFVGRTE